jgi:hypothetical protein
LLKQLIGPGEVTFFIHPSWIKTKGCIIS